MTMSNEIILYDPSIGSMNEGDTIIVDSASKQIQDMFPDSKYIILPTQMPVSKRVLKWFSNVDLRFVCGTNLLRNQMLYQWGGLRPHFSGIRQWDFSLKDIDLYGPAVLLGCGWQKYQNGKDRISEFLWHRILDSRYLHSVRDEYTAEKLAELGINNVLNTGCPTLWMLTPEHCREIPKDKAENVVTTVTDYCPDEKADQFMLNLLSENYKRVYIWLQGHEDDNYVKKLTLKSNVIVLNGGLEAYDRLLDTDDIEFVGTRLHGGIRALQHKKRATFIAVDNRTIEMGKNRGLVFLERESIKDLNDLINSEQVCSISIPKDNIDRFKEQFIGKQR